MTHCQLLIFCALILIWGAELSLLPPPLCWLSLNNSETMKAVTSAYCRILQPFIRDIGAKFGIPNSPQSSDIGQNSDVSLSYFRISGQSLIKENCHNSRTSSNIDMKYGPITKRDKRNKASKDLTMTLCR